MNSGFAITLNLISIKRFTIVEKSKIIIIEYLIFCDDKDNVKLDIRQKIPININIIYLSVNIGLNNIP